MNTRNHQLAALTIFLFGVSNAQADRKECIELKSEAQIEQQYIDEHGQKATRLVPPAKIIPGNEVIYTITAKNTCDKSIDNVVINNAVPEHMSYVGNSAVGVGTEISYSLNGKDFNQPAALTVKETTGESRSARADEINSIRWTYNNAFQPGATGFVRFRAVVK